MAREVLSRFCSTLEPVIAVQGLGSYPIVLAGTAEQKARFLPPIAGGHRLATFSLFARTADTGARGVTAFIAEAGTPGCSVGAQGVGLGLQARDLALARAKGRVPGLGLARLLRDLGIHLMELLDLEALARDRAHEFLFMVAPLRITGGVGSPVTPLAIV